MSGPVDTIHYVPAKRLPNYNIVATVVTPRFKRFGADLFVITGQDDNFFEWSSCWLWVITADLDWRPTDQLRLSARYLRRQYVRLSNWTSVSSHQIPRLKVEYQLSRPIFLRVVAQYDTNIQDSLRDDSRTNFPILIRDPATNRFTRASRLLSNNLQMNWLFSYQPTPGTVVFLGYGSSLTEPDRFAFRDLARVNDGFFVKLTYLIRW